MHSKGLILLLSVVGSLAYPPNITFLTPGNVPSELTLSGRHHNLNDYQKDIIRRAFTYCPYGWFAGYKSPDFKSINFLTTANHHPACFIIDVPLELSSLRYLGPSDSEEEAISLYEGFFEGEGIIVTTAANNIGFQQDSFVVTGNSNWTVFPNNEFSGYGWCIRGEKEFDWAFERKFLSVIKGCNLSEEEKEKAIASMKQ